MCCVTRLYLNVAPKRRNKSAAKSTLALFLFFKSTPKQGYKDFASFHLLFPSFFLALLKLTTLVVEIAIAIACPILWHLSPSCPVSRFHPKLFLASLGLCCSLFSTKTKKKRNKKRTSTWVQKNVFVFMFCRTFSLLKMTLALGRYNIFS